MAGRSRRGDGSPTSAHDGGDPVGRGGAPVPSLATGFGYGGGVCEHPVHKAVAPWMLEHCLQRVEFGVIGRQLQEHEIDGRRERLPRYGTKNTFILKQLGAWRAVPLSDFQSMRRLRQTARRGIMRASMRLARASDSPSGARPTRPTNQWARARIGAQPEAGVCGADFAELDGAAALCHRASKGRSRGPPPRVAHGAPTRQPDRETAYEIQHRRHYQAR